VSLVGVMLLMAAVVATAVLGAQQPVAPQATFRAGVEVVAIDFLAVNRDGRPVGDRDSR
jgi:hypothetical protein